MVPDKRRREGRALEKTYSIAEVSKALRIPATTLRYYEKAGLMEPVRKNAGGQRRYGERDLRRVRFIQLLRNGGVPIAEIRRYVDLVYEGEQTVPERKQLLLKQLARLEAQAAELEETIRGLRDIIDHYEDTLVRREMNRRAEEKDAYKR